MCEAHWDPKSRRHTVREVFQDPGTDSAPVRGELSSRDQRKRALENAIAASGRIRRLRRDRDWRLVSEI
jgi:hypothetical protein